MTTQSGQGQSRRTLTRVVLIAVGVVLMGVGVAGWLVEFGQDTAATSRTTTTVTGTGSGGPRVTERSSTHPGKGSTRSEAISTAFLTAGVALVGFAVLFERITEFGLFGATFKLRQGDVASVVGEIAGRTPRPEVAERAFSRAVRLLSRRSAAGVPPTQDEIQLAAEQALAEVDPGLQGHVATSRLRSGDYAVQIDHLREPAGGARLRVTTEAQFLPVPPFPAELAEACRRADPELGRAIYCLDTANEQVTAAVVYALPAAEQAPIRLEAFGHRTDGDQRALLVTLRLLIEYVRAVAARLLRPPGLYFAPPRVDHEIAQQLALLGFSPVPAPLVPPGLPPGAYWVHLAPR